MGNQKVIPIEWRAFSHRLFGDNQMPSAAIIPAAESAVKILGTGRDWETYQEMAARCRDSFPELSDRLTKRPINALELAPDWQAVLAVVAWVRDHPRSGQFLRQMDAPGVHTKLVEKHRGVIADLLDRVLPADAIDASARGTSGFARRDGFRDKPERIRIRFLDPPAPLLRNALASINLDAAAFAALDPPVERVFITEMKSLSRISRLPAKPGDFRLGLWLECARRSFMAPPTRHPLLGRHRHPRLRHPGPAPLWFAPCPLDADEPRGPSRSPRILDH